MTADIISQVPHLTTALTGPLQTLEAHLLETQIPIEAWFRQQWQSYPAPVHSSVDIRNAGFKLAPVDTNFFPAGFNNLNPDFLPICIQAAQACIERNFPSAKRIMIIPESHTRNKFYFESLATLYEIFSKAGYEVRIGSLIENLSKPTTFSAPSGRQVLLEPVKREKDYLYIDDFKPCVIILNNDLSSGVPDILKDLAQPIRPPISLGWTSRTKTNHFGHYTEVAREFSEMIDIDPWLITPAFRHCGSVDFMQHEGEVCLVKHSTALLADIAEKYKQYAIEQKPFVVIKADKGTYGMSVMSISDPQQLTKLNRKQRTHMSATKGRQKVTDVIIQEGVYTFETWGEDNAVAEPVVYMIGPHVVGGFYRVHKNRGEHENLNAPGMHFQPLAFAQACNNPCATTDPTCHPNRFYAYGVIARLALLAAARELQAAGIQN